MCGTVGSSPADETAEGRAGRPALRRCIGVEPDRFAREHWSRRPLLTRGDDLPRGFDDLLTLEAVDELVSRRGLRTPFLRVAKDGQVVESRRFTGPGGAGAEIVDQVADDKVLDLFLDGSTLVLQGLHRMWPPIMEFAGALTADLGHPVQVNAYVTPPQSRGFSAHYDVHDVFVLQVVGEKRWVVHAPVHQDPLRDQPWTDRRTAVAEAARTREPVVDTVLRPGDALYLPRGYLHAAEALGDVSAHLTVGVHPVTRYALVEALTALAADNAALRASLPLGVDVADPAQLGPELDATVEALVARLRSADPTEVSRRVRRQVWSSTRPGPIAPLAQATATRSLGSDTVVRLRPQLRHAVRSAGQEVVLELPGRTLTLPAVTEPAVKAVLGGDPVTVGDLPGLDAADQLVLVRRLLREAVVVPVPAGPG